MTLAEIRCPNCRNLIARSLVEPENTVYDHWYRQTHLQTWPATAPATELHCRRCKLHVTLSPNSAITLGQAPAGR